MFRRLFYGLFFLVFLSAGLLSTYLLYGHYIAWEQCSDAWGRCFDASGMQDLPATGLPLAYASITFVLGLLTLATLIGMLRRPRRLRVAR